VVRGYAQLPTQGCGVEPDKTLANECAPNHIRVVVILVGIIRSGQITRPAVEPGEDVDEYLANLADRLRIPLGRVGEPHEFGDTATFLLSPRASYLTGTAVHVDGGLSPVI
jgi:NAD(P)-dependent dehydrogenase (short-subunit alcohol dehydrogenase family)